MTWVTKVEIAAATCLFSAVSLFAGQARAALIYDNGPLPTGTTSESGVAAPAGAQWYEP